MNEQVRDSNAHIHFFFMSQVLIFCERGNFMWRWTLIKYVNVKYSILPIVTKKMFSTETNPVCTESSHKFT